MEYLPKFFFVFDVESVGLYGSGFAVGYTVLDKSGDEVDAGCFACPSVLADGTDADRDWINENVPILEATHDNPIEVRREFWKAWKYWLSQGAAMFAETPFPVENLFLIDCVQEIPMRKKEAPYPLYDISSIMLSFGMDPMAEYDRFITELPKHNPLADARQSARLLMEALSATSSYAKDDSNWEEEEPTEDKEDSQQADAEEELAEILKEWDNDE